MTEVTPSRLKEALRQQLIDCGWRDQLKAHCKGCQLFFDYTAFVVPTFSLIQEIVKQKGVEQVTVEELVAEITPKGRGMSQKLLLMEGVSIFLPLSLN